MPVALLTEVGVIVLVPQSNIAWVITRNRAIASLFSLLRLLLLFQLSSAGVPSWTAAVLPWAAQRLLLLWEVLPMTKG